MADENKKQQTNCGGRAYRMNAKAVLAEKMKRVQGELNSLETLLCKIPWAELSADEEQNLWNYFVTKH